MASKVCVLDPLRAELYEKGTFPDCDFHLHVSHSVADQQVGNDDGQGRARSLAPQRDPVTGAMDRRRRITWIPSILRWHAVPAMMSVAGESGPTIMQPVYANLR